MADTAEKKINEENVISESPTPKRRKIDSEESENFVTVKGPCENSHSHVGVFPTISEPEIAASTSHDPFDHPEITEHSDEECGSPQSVSSSGSGISGLSDINKEKWRIGKKPMDWVQRQIIKGQKPKKILESILPAGIDIPDGIDDMSMWKAILNIISEPDPRVKLTEYNTLDDAVELLKTCKNIIILTGAGVSVSCGIPDFRSKNGIYARLSEEYKDLPDPQAMFDIAYFRRNQKPFFNFAREIFPGNFEPSIAHKFIRKVEEHGKLLRNYTQNIDALEQQAGIKKVIECHGSFSKASCMICKTAVDAEDIKDDIMKQQIPRCKICPSDTEMSIMKPNIVFFGEGLPSTFHDRISEDKEECDLLIVMGSSMKVRPVALIPSSLPEDVPQILINKEPLRHLNFDINLYGNCNTIIRELCHRLGDGWNVLCPDYVPLHETDGEAIIKDKQESIATQLIEENKFQQSSLDKEKVEKETRDEGKADQAVESTSEQPETISEMTAEGESEQRKENEGLIEEKNSRQIDSETRNLWIPKEMNISAYLPENSYAFLPPHRYIFEGAEYLYDLVGDSSSSSSPVSGSTRSSPSGSRCSSPNDFAKLSSLSRLDNNLNEGNDDLEHSAIVDESHAVTEDRDQENVVTSSVNDVCATNDIE